MYKNLGSYMNTEQNMYMAIIWILAIVLMVKSSYGALNIIISPEYNFMWYIYNMIIFFISVIGMLLVIDNITPRLIFQKRAKVVE